MGRNGSGKSTLLKVLCGIYPADSGHGDRRRRGITPILELGVGWNPELDAIDNVYLVGSVMGLSLREIRASLDDILAFAELERFARLQLKHYSSGMASRLAYAVAFRAVREVLVLDEIFAVGDAGFRAKCEARYRELHAAGHAVMLVSHDPRVISTFCDRAILMDAGRIVAEGSGDEIAARYLARRPQRRSLVRVGTRHGSAPRVVHRHLLQPGAVSCPRRWPASARRRSRIYEICVVDDGSTDARTRQALRTVGSDVAVVVSDEPGTAGGEESGRVPNVGRIHLRRRRRRRPRANAARTIGGAAGCQPVARLRLALARGVRR